MTQTPSQHQNILPLRLLTFLVAAAAYRSHAFVTSPLARPVVYSQTGSRSQALFVVADPPGREEEKEKSKHGGDDDAWITTSNGGFLPKIPGIFRKKTAPGRPKEGVQAPTEVLTIQEYKAVVADEKEQMVCVRFYAPWCKACKAVQQPFRKLCRENPSVKFVEVPLTKENAFLHEGLGIPSLPYGHIYHPEAGLVEEHKIKKKEFPAFAQVLGTYVREGCEVEYPEDDVCRQASN